jgi:hypothetical protein
MCWWMMIGEVIVIGLIGNAGFPVQNELEFLDTTSNPVEMALERRCLTVSVAILLANSFYFSTAVGGFE